MTNRKGFTLIELLIVVAIIGILAAIAVPNFMNAQIRAKIARVQSDLKAMATAIEMYRTDNNAYPDSCSLEVQGAVQFRAGEIWAPVAYTTVAPVDPFNKREGAIDNNTFAKDEYFYINKGSCDWFVAGIDWAVKVCPNEAPKHPAYIMASQGPNDLSELQAVKTPLLYSASNGLITPGDIVVFGPENGK